MICKKYVQCDGIVLINKPLGLTSNHVLQRVKRLYCALKAGHTGSLDPLATGMLPICMGEATKFSQVLLERDKSYSAIGVLGIKTTTADAAGEVIVQVSDFSVTPTQLEQAISSFQGESIQTPSIYSALKYQGKPLYHYARKGIDVPLKSRKINIQSLKLIAFDGVKFTIDVTCSKGTYIRNLVEDIGEILGTGAYVAALHRTSISGFEKIPMVTLEMLEAMSSIERESYLLAPEYPLAHLPRLYLDETAVEHLRQGKIVDIPLSQFSEGTLLRVYTHAEKFVGLVTVVSENQIHAKRLMRIDDATTA